MRAVWTCPSCGWRQPDDRPRICGRDGEPCNGDRSWMPLPTSAEPTAVFYELSKDEIVEDMAAPPEIKDFPDDLVKLIRDYEPVGLKALQDEIDETKRDLQALRADITTDKEWRETFKSAIDRHTKAVEDHDRQLGDVLKGLEKEQEARAAGDKKIEEKLGGMSNMFFGARLIWLAAMAVTLIVVGAVVGPLVPKGLTALAKATAPAASSPPAAAPALPSPKGTAPKTQP
jgi:hypothetical protein